MSMRHDAKDKPTSAELRKRLKFVIDNDAVAIVFQPIVDLRRAEIIGYEALSRPSKEAGFDGPAEMFIAADEYGMINEIERVARKKIFSAVDEFDRDLLLFFNNSPPVFTSDSFVEVISAEIEYLDHLQLNRLVLEVTERTSPNLIADLNVRAMLLRELGFQVAIDDVGAGVSGLNQIMSLRPNWIKLDRELINHIDYDPLKQNLIRTFVRFSRFSNIELIAEGVERVEELNVLIDLGVTHAQGFYLARPGDHTQTLDSDLQKLILQRQELVSERSREDIRAVRVGSLIIPVQSFDREAKVSEILHAAEHSVMHNGVVVKDGRRFIGWIDAGTIDHFLKDAAPEARLENCPRVMCTVSAEEESLAEVLEIVASRPDESQAQPVVVQRGGEIVGIVVLRDLLRAAARAQSRSLTHYEQLTGLPSRVNADIWLAEHIRAADPVDLAFIDLCNFDGYNLTYGVEMGDAMLLRLASLVRRVESENKSRIKFAAHLSGDRFLLVCTSDCRDLMQQLAEEFEQQRDEFFTAVDNASGAYNVQAPSGSKQTMPLTDLRVVYLQQPLLTCSHPRELHEQAAQLRIRSREEGDLTDPIITDRRSQSAARSATA